MPQIQINTPYGFSFGIHSSDPETIGRWFAEIAKRCTSTDSAAMDHYLRIWPMWQRNPQTGKDEPDWCVNSTHGWCHDIQFDGTMEGLVQILNRTIEGASER